MSAHLMILPRLWAMAETPLANAVHAIQARSEEAAFEPNRRKGPHSLRLVRASAGQTATAYRPLTAPGALAARLEPLPAPAPLPVALPVRAMPVRVQPQLQFYRVYTEAMLRRYMKMSMESGRVPSLIGQDMFRGNVSHCRVTGFDDSVIFVEDVNKCLAKLEPGTRFLVRRIALEGYTQGETAAMQGIALRTVVRRYAEGIDRLTRLFLERGLMEEQLEPVGGELD